MKWEGVSLDTLLEHTELDRNALFVTAYSDGGYTTNIPLTEIINGQSFIALKYDDKPLAPEHVVPGLPIPEVIEIMNKHGYSLQLP